MDFKTLCELMKSRDWRLEHLYWIVDEQGKKQRFRMRPAQREFLQSIHYFNVILKARQLGFTTLIDILFLDMVLFTKNFEAVIIAHKVEDAQKIFLNKVKFPYDNLPAELRKLLRPVKCDAGELILSNGSSIRVTTSARSGTIQALHISEYGKICAKYPHKAREIKTGSLPAVHQGGFVFVESTAEGNAGHFFELCEQGIKDKLMGRELSPLEFKFHFFPWWQNSEYRSNPVGVDIPARLLEYFDRLALEHDITLDEEQMAWYALTEKNLGEDMHREHPSMPQEAFQVSQEGTYYKRPFERIYAENRICAVPYDDSLPVFTFWDLGISDDTAIWFLQFAGREVHAIDYYENSGEGLPHYAKILQERGYFYGGHFAPHDIAVRELGTGKSRIDTAKDLGIKFEAVATNVDVIGGIEQCRSLLGRCWFEKTKCDAGIKCLENYRKEWDDKHGMFKAKPLHDWTSHGADAFRTAGVSIGNNQVTVLRAPSSGSRATQTTDGGWGL